MSVINDFKNRNDGIIIEDPLTYQTDTHALTKAGIKGVNAKDKVVIVVNKDGFVLGEEKGLLDPCNSYSGRDIGHVGWMLGMNVYSDFVLTEEERFLKDKATIYPKRDHKN